MIVPSLSVPTGGRSLSVAWMGLALVGWMGLALLGGCGHSACHEFMGKVCDACATEQSPAWRAACACWNNPGLARSQGFRCKDPDGLDQDACRVGLEQWDGHSCSLMDAGPPEEPRLDP